MKGFGKVNRSDMYLAITKYDRQRKQAKEIRDFAIEEFYKEKYLNGGWFIRWRKKDLTPVEFARSMCPSFYTLCDTLGYLVSEENRKIWNDYTWDVGLDGLIACTSLVESSSEQYLLLDDQLCKWVNTWRSK